MPATATRRALGVIRLSVGNVNATGEATQRKRITARVEADECQLADWAVDLDVSATYSPWDRPKLGTWLKERLDEFDVLYVYKLDRIVRSVRDLSNLLDWCDEHGKSLVSVEEGFDLSKPWGRTIAKILAVLAEAELGMIRERIQASREAMRAQGRWPGGLVPFGRVAVPAQDGNGYTLELCPTYGPWLLRTIEKFLEMRSFTAVARWLNENSVPTPQDIARMRAANAGNKNTRLDRNKAKPRGSKWAATSVQAVLTSRNLLGWYTRRDGSIERHPDGTPVLRSMPVLSLEQFEELQEVVETVKYSKGSSSRRGPLLGVLFCAGCEQPLYYVRAQNGRKARFRCQGNRSQGIQPCQNSYFAEDIFREVEYAFLKQVGSFAIRERVKLSDDKAAVEIAVLEGRLQQLNDEFRSGHLSATEFATMMAEAANRIEELKSQPNAKATWAWRDTGQTFAEWWKENPDWQIRREKLIGWGVKVRRGSGLLYFRMGWTAREQITGPDAMAPLSVVLTDNELQEAA